MRPAGGMVARLRALAAYMAREVFALYLAARDPRVPWYAKAFAAAVAAYALSPIDLVPDFIPLLGQLDDLILVPLGIALAVRLVPPEVMVELRAAAAQRFRDKRPVSVAAAIVIVLIWLALAAAVGRVLL